ncbi:ead/Ea22-like family protein, partial [Enterobacter asburiae]|uniref:ead/Ea22-like family protein n=1 Tax=Enterobacter asburiae TaxID=61645 RepID=UPI000F884EEF
IDKQGLREAAENAKIAGEAPVMPFDQRIMALNDFMMQCTPAAVMALLDELEAKDKRIAELEVLAFNPALLDVISERQRQRAVEGWTSEHDDAYQNSELADAAACYAINAHNQGFSTPAHWPWAPDWWKQSGPRRDLVKAGALILAEIERIDRAAAGKGEAS